MKKDNILVIILVFFGVALCCVGHVIVMLGMSSLAAFLAAIWFDYKWLFVGVGVLLLAAALGKVAINFVYGRRVPPKRGPDEEGAHLRHDLCQHGDSGSQSKKAANRS